MFKVVSSGVGEVPGQVAGDALLGALHSFLALGPVGGADISPSLVEPQCVEYAHRLRNAPAQREVVDEGVSHGSRPIDKEEAPQGHRVIVQDPVGTGNLLLEVRDDDPSRSDGEEACPFTHLYWDFLSRNRARFENNPRMSIPLASLRRLSNAVRDDHRRHARAWRKRARDVSG